MMNFNLLRLINYNNINGFNLILNNKTKTRIKNYKIYGNTINGKNVGNKTANLFDVKNSIYKNFISENNEIIASANNLKLAGNVELPQNNNRITFSFNAFTKGNSGTTNNEGLQFQFDYDDETFSTFNLSNSNTDLITISGTSTEGKIVTGFHFNYINHPDNIWCISNFCIIEGSELTTYEPYGYCIPVTIEGKNLLPNNVEWIRNNSSNPQSSTDNMNNRIKTNLIPIDPSKNNIIVSGLTEDFIFLTFRYYNKISDTDCITQNSTGDIPNNTNYVSILLGGENFNDETKNVLKTLPIQLEYGSVATEYEPYSDSNITNIYIPEQVKIVKNEIEYIDFGNQKQYRIRKNLWDENYTNITDTNNSNVIYKTLQVGIGDFTLSTNMPSSNNVCNLFLISGNTTTGANSSTNGVSAEQSQTVESSDSGEITIGYRYYNDIDPRSYHVQLEKGSIATEYEPYIKNIELDVDLPILQSLPNTNNISFNTEIKPSKVYMEKIIRKINTKRYEENANNNQDNTETVKINYGSSYEAHINYPFVITKTTVVNINE